MTFANPILPLDYSDPDVIRVGVAFYLAASSFHSVPGLPILHSTDLVHWSIAGYVLPRLPWPGYDVPAHGKGVWAPALRFHGGRFFLYFSTPDEGLFVCTADRAEGPWSAPTCLKAQAGWIDPCPFWDEDGSAYLVNAFAKSRIGFKSVLRVTRMAPDGLSLLEEGRFVYDGQDHHVTIEGPKLYKRNGWYYLFAPAGGVKHGWQVVLRSRSVWGPWEERTVLHQGNSAVNGPHQGAWVSLESGEDWFLHFQDQGAFGRVVHAQPLVWEFDWPRIGVDTNGDGIGEPVPSPNLPKLAGTVASHTTEPWGPGPTSPWQWQANPPAEALRTDAPAGVLRLNTLAAYNRSPADLPHTLTRKFEGPGFRAEVTVDLSAGAPGDRAGLAVCGEASSAVVIQRTEAGWELGVLHDALYQKVRDLKGPQLRLALTVDTQARCRFEPSGHEFTAVPGRWVGAKLGLFAVSGSSERGGWADFSSFTMMRDEESP